MADYGVDSRGSGERLVADSCGNGNETFCTMDGLVVVGGWGGGDI